MRYVDGYLLPDHKKNLQAYFQMVKKAGQIWREHGALEYREGVGDDLKVKMSLQFPIRQTESGRNRRILVDCLQVTVPSWPREYQGDEGLSY